MKSPLSSTTAPRHCCSIFLPCFRLSCFAMGGGRRAPVRLPAVAPKADVAPPAPGTPPKAAVQTTAGSIPEGTPDSDATTPSLAAVGATLEPKSATGASLQPKPTVRATLESKPAPGAAPPQADAADSAAASEIFTLLSIRVDQQELGAAEKAILSKDGLRALGAAVGARQAADGGKQNEAVACRVVGMYGSKPSMLSVLAKNGVGVSQAKTDSLDAAPGIFGVLLNKGAQFSTRHGARSAGTGDRNGKGSTENAEDWRGSAEGGMATGACVEPVLCVFFWHPGKALPQEARSSVCCSFVRYVVDLADEVLVLLEDGDPAILAASAAGGGRSTRPVRRSQRGRVALRQVSEDSAAIFPGASVVAKHPSDPGLVPRLSAVASRRGAVLYQRHFAPLRRTQERTVTVRSADVPRIFADLKASHVVSWERLSYEGRATLLQSLDSAAWEVVQAERDRAQRAKEEALEAEAGELKEHLVSATAAALERAATHFLAECYPEGEKALQSCGAQATGQEGEGASTGVHVAPLEYTQACLELAALWGPAKGSPQSGQAGREGGLLHAHTRVKLLGDTKLAATRDMAQLLGLWSPESEVVFLPSAKPGYGGPLFYGQAVHIALFKPGSERVSSQGPLLVYPAAGEAFGPVRLDVPVQLVRSPSEVKHGTRGFALQVSSQGPTPGHPLRIWMAATARGLGFPVAFLSPAAAVATAAAEEKRSSPEAEGASSEDRKSGSSWRGNLLKTMHLKAIGKLAAIRKPLEGAQETQEDRSEDEGEGGLQAEHADSQGAGAGSPRGTREEARGAEARGVRGETGVEEGHGEGREGGLVEERGAVVQTYRAARATFLALVRQQLDLGALVREAELRAGQALGAWRQSLREEQDSSMYAAINAKLHDAFQALPPRDPSHTQTGSEQRGSAGGLAAPPYLQAEVLLCKVHLRNRELIILTHTWEEEVSQQQQWEVREVTCLRADLEALGAPGAARAQAPLPIQPVLLEPRTALKGLCQGATLEHCSLLGTGDTLCLVSETPCAGLHRGVTVFLGSRVLRSFPRGGHRMAFDESSRLLALFDRGLGKVQVYRIDETFRAFDWVGADVEVGDGGTGACDVEWMAFVPGRQQLLLLEGQCMRAFEISQAGMARPRAILLPTPFSGKACVSPDGACLLVLSPTPPPAPSNSPCPGDPAPQRQPPGPPAGHGTDAPPRRTEESIKARGGPQGAEGVGLPVGSSVESGGSAGGGLQLEVYLVETMRPLCTLALPGLEGPPQSWDLGLVLFGKQLNLTLLHRPTATLVLRVLSITTSRQTCEVEDVGGGGGAAAAGGWAEAGAGPGVPGSSPGHAKCTALEALYHAFDKFATSPFLAETQRELTVHLVPPPRNASDIALQGPQGSSSAAAAAGGGAAGAGSEGKDSGVPGDVLVRAVHDMQRRLASESAKDFSKLTLRATCEGPPESVDLLAGPQNPGAPTGAPQGAPKGSLEGALEGAPKGAPKGALEGALEGAPQGWGKGVPWEGWVRRLKCLVPVQIARAQGNSLRLLQDGLQMPQDCDYTDAVSLSQLLSFGPYEEILSSWAGPIRVVSSMGKQSSGKSYLLNHLSGALLDISGGRCTDGVWLTAREAGGCLFVLLDFEGLGSFERTEQEDMLLSLLNAAVSSLTIFNKKDFHFDKEMEAVFSRFQSGVNVLKGDTRLFQGLFYIALKDVADNDVESVQAEFRQKITRICEGNNDNFLLRMYDGGFEVGAMAPFHDREYQDSVADLGCTLGDVRPAYTGGRAFLRDLKLVLAQISTKDWSPLDSHRVALRTGILRRLLPCALRLGRTADPGSGPRARGSEGASEGAFEGELVDLDTEEAVGEGEEGGAGEEEGEGETGVGVQGKQPQGAGAVAKAAVGDAAEGVSAAATAESGSAQGLPLPVAVAAALARNPDAGLELPVGADRDSRAAECLARLRALYSAAVGRRACADGKWHSGFEAFVGAVVERRGRRVLRWLWVNTREFVGDGGGEVRKLLADAREGVAEARGALGVCASQCAKCYFRCVLRRGHRDPHSCEDTHMCGRECTFCLGEEQRAAGAPAQGSREGPSKGVGRGVGAVMGCRDKAGHGGAHDCGVRAHTCGHSCHLQGRASNCNAVCSRKASHEGEHRCNSTRHVCRAPCSLPGCTHACTLPYDVSHTRHQCHDRVCPAPCGIPSCTRTCGEKDHFHSVGGAVTHFCGQAHPCQELCESDGICEVRTEILNKKEVFRGARGEFEYERVSEQTGVTKPCCKLIPPGRLAHAGPHCHSEDASAHHFCDARCPLCEYICARPHGHRGLHSTSHGGMKHAHFVAEAREIDVGGRQYVWGEQGVAEMCMMHCKAQGRGHVHLAPCKAGSRGGACAATLCDRSRHETRKYGPDFDVPKDEFTHQAFWASFGFQDPCPKEEQGEFELCGHYCPSREHDRQLQGPGPAAAAAAAAAAVAAAGAGLERVYCKKKMWHGRLAPLVSSPEERAVGSGYISCDGHWFPCRHAPKGRYHMIFVVDRSLSMAGKDWVPQTAAFRTQSNRLGCVYESIVRFIRTRAAGLDGCPSQDAMSVVLFDNLAETVVEAREMEEGVMRAVVEHGPRGWTSYVTGLREARQVLERAATNKDLKGKKPVLIFLSDGESGRWSDPLGLCREMRAQFPELVLHTMMFGAEPNSSVLQEMATAGGGQFSVSLDEVQLAATFENLAKSLCNPVSSLMAGGKC